MVTQFLKKGPNIILFLLFYQCLKIHVKILKIRKRECVNMLKEKERNQNEIYIILNKYIYDKHEEQQFKQLLVYQGDFKGIQILCISSKEIYSGDSSSPHYQLTYYVNLIFHTKKHILCKLISFYFDKDIEHIRNLYYYGTYLDYMDGVPVGVDDESLEYDEHEEFLLDYLKEIELMNYIRLHNLDEGIVKLQKYH